jgi:hypothetical protein
MLSRTDAELRNVTAWPENFVIATVGFLESYSVLPSRRATERRQPEWSHFGQRELAEAIKSTVAKHQAMTGRLHSSSGHA